MKHFLNFVTKFGLTDGTRLIMFLAIFFWIVSADFLKIVSGFGWFLSESGWFRLVLWCLVF